MEESTESAVICSRRPRAATLIKHGAEFDPCQINTMEVDQKTDEYGYDASLCARNLMISRYRVQAVLVPVDKRHHLGCFSTAYVHQPVLLLPTSSRPRN